MVWMRPKQCTVVHYSAGQLDDKGHHVGPGFGDAEAGQFLFGFVDERSEIVDDGHVVAGAETLSGRDGKVSPPFPIGLRKDLAFGGNDAVTMEEGVEAVLSCRALGDKTSPVSDEGTEFTDVVRRNPDLGDHVGGQKLGQG